MEKELRLLLAELNHLEIDDIRLNRLIWAFEERLIEDGFIGTMDWEFFKDFIQKGVDKNFGVL